MIHALITGDLIADPTQRTAAATGRVFTTAAVRVAAGAESMIVSLTAFSDTVAAKLLQLKRGDSLAATGVLEPTAWTDRDGNEWHGWRLTASQLMTVYEAGKRRKAAQAEEGDR